MVRGFAAAYQFMNDAKNHDEVRNIVKDSLKISDDIARQIFAPYTRAGIETFCRGAASWICAPSIACCH